MVGIGLPTSITHTSVIVATIEVRRFADTRPAGAVRPHFALPNRATVAARSRAALQLEILALRHQVAPRNLYCPDSKLRSQRTEWDGAERGPSGGRGGS